MVNTKKSKLKKRKSSPRIEETNLVVKLYTSFILSAAETFGNNTWKISNENKNVGSCFGLALESELGDTFLKFKHRRTLKGDDLLSVNIKNEFSLAKYILFSKTISNLNIKKIVLCTTATVRENNLLIKNSNKDADFIDKTFEGCEKYIINKSCSQTILKNVKEYQDNISRNHENKNWKKVPVENEDIVSFCEKFVCIIIKEDIIEENILRKIEFLQNKFSFSMTSYEDVIEQIGNWCGNDEYMTNTHVKAILFKEQNKNLCETKDVISFKEYYSFDTAVKILHIKPGEAYELNINKIRRSLLEMYKNQNKSYENISEEVLFLDTVNDFATTKEIVECFVIPKYKFFIISLMNETKAEVEDVCRRIENALDYNDDKRVIIITNEIFFNDYRKVRTIVDKITIESIDNESKQKILKKAIMFQGEPIKVEDIENLNIDEYIIKDVMQSEEYVLGRNVNYFKVIDNYIPRELINTKNESFLDSQLLLHLSHKITVVADVAGSGKTSLLKNLGYLWKKNNPAFYVLHLDLQMLDKYLNKNNVNSPMINFLYFHEEIDSISGKNILKATKKFIFIDGIDEISVKSRNELLCFIKNNIEEFEKIVITTRKYYFILEELEILDDLEILSLQPFSSDEQLELFGKYLNCDSNTDIGNFFKQIDSNNLKILVTPLFISMIAEMYTNKENRESYLNLLNNINIFQFYKLLFDNQRIKNASSFSENKSATINLIYLKQLNLPSLKKTIKILELLNIDGNVDTLKLMVNLSQLVDEKKIIHETFIEYFVAEYLWSLLLQKNSDILKIILEEILLDKDYSGICLFLNGLLESNNSAYSFDISDISKIYNTIMDEINWNETKNLLNLLSNQCLNILQLILNNYDNSSKVVNVNSKSESRAIYLSVWNLEIMKYLLTKGADESLKGGNEIHFFAIILISCSNSKNRLRTTELPHIESCLTFLGINIQSFVNLPVQTEENVIKIFRYLRDIQNDTFLTIQDDDGCTLLHYAANLNLPKILNYFIENCNMNLICNKHGEFPQHNAAESNAFEVIKYFKTINADFNVADNDGDTLLHIASMYNSLDVIIYLIEQYNLSLDRPNKNESFPQHYAAAGNALDVIKYFKTINADFNVTNNDCETLLHTASMHNSLEVLKYLIEECQMDLNLRNKFGTPPQHYASLNDSLEVFKYLIEECEMNLNVVNIYGSYPQHHAARGNALAVMKYLISRDIDLNVTDYDGHTLLHRAAINNSLDVLKYLIEDCKMDLNVSNKHGCFPLHHAATGNSLDVIKYFKEQNIDLNVQDYNGNTLLHKASMRNSIDVLKYLIEDCKMNVNILNDYGDFPQYHAVIGNSLDVIKYFKEQNNFNVLDRNGDTLLHKAVRSNSINNVKYLIEECNMSPRIRNYRNQSPLDYAFSRKTSSVFQYFKEQNII